MKVFLHTLLVFGVLAGTAQHVHAQQKKGAAKVPEGTRSHVDVEYGPHGERNRLDLYVPKGDGPFPLVIWVHGGTWLGGSKAGGGPAMRMLSRGYAVASINYRLSSQAIFPAQIEDCKAAVRFLRANARKYELDPHHFGVWGSSAGGHLVALLGTSGNVKELEGDGRNNEVSSRVQAVCDWFGPTDLTKMAEQTTVKGPIDHDSPNSPESKLIGGPIQQNKDKAKKANPIEYVSKDDPPFLIIHGDKDPLVPHAQSQILHDALKKSRVDSTLIIVAGAGHGNGIGTADNLKKIEDFFDSHLKAKRQK